MLAVSSLRDENQGEVEGCIPIGGEDNFPEFGDGNLLDSIDFDDLFTSINDGDVFPDLDIDSDILADFSAGGSEESEFNTSVSNIEKSSGDQNNAKKDEESDDDKVSISGSSTTTSQETLNNKRDETATTINPTPKHGGANKCKKSSSTTAQSKNFQGKRKVKVDWTPELHRRFVQAVEQLGVDKAVPSRILDLMGIDCLTRHNIASHLQKYRSHRKHLLAREVGAASWSQRRQMYGSEAGVMKKRDVNPWMAPTIGFPPPVNHMHHHFRPLHVWGHPTHVDQSLMHLRPNNLPYSLSPPPPPNTWPLNLPPRSEPNYSNPNHQRVPNEINSVSPYFPRPLATTRYARPPGPGLPPLGFYEVDPASIDVPAASGPHPLHDSHPSKESIDAAIGDVISKPWLPLPLGLKPPSMDSVMGELHLQGFPKVPHNF